MLINFIFVDIMFSCQMIYLYGIRKSFAANKFLSSSFRTALHYLIANFMILHNSVSWNRILHITVEKI